ncbi:polyunsaturated fatty acid 5-lipoxygenase-like [Plectropomus leopardus]|uniref:polyunsaturated fatty acid 5-lipoxygenase-like n=1 Tax=Plectropomus leopardus TaxID=160734 RepID=UPI001C4D6035|nr:polyunsaturated fatty acid 5-lipoxygenase-like [Plectropomus leopardus]
MIRKCTKLPDKFPVTHEMVSVSLERELTLEQEIEAGNIYIIDFEVLDGISPNSTDPCTLQYLAAPICLLYKNAQNKILPIAIQLGQSPGEDNPIFLPTDGQYDWLLAKIWVRSADFQYHQTITHLLRTHLMTEVFAIAMYRQLPAVHPVYKLLIPHIRFTIAINTKAREQLICECGIFDKANATGGGGHVQLVQKAVKNLTFRSLCFPDIIKSRGVDNTEELPTYFYRDDGYRVWEATKR